MEEQEEIAEAYLNRHILQRFVAQRYRVKVQLVRDLVADTKKRPVKQERAKELASMKARRQTAIKDAAMIWHDQGKPLVNTK